MEEPEADFPVDELQLAIVRPMACEEGCDSQVEVVTLPHLAKRAFASIAGCEAPQVSRQSIAALHIGLASVRSQTVAS